MMDQENEKKQEETAEEIVPEEDLPENLLPKLKQLRDELKQCQSEKQEYLAMSQRLKADYLNLRKEAESAREETIKFANQPLLLDFLSLADSFEQAFANRAAWQAVDENWRSGVEYIYAKLQGLLQQYGLTEISAQGESFDPLKHHALELVETTDRSLANRVVEVVQKGYALHGRIVRPAQVKVGK